MYIEEICKNIRKITLNMMSSSMFILLFLTKRIRNYPLYDNVKCFLCIGRTFDVFLENC